MCGEFLFQHVGAACAVFLRFGRINALACGFCAVAHVLRFYARWPGGVGAQWQQQGEWGGNGKKTDEAHDVNSLGSVSVAILSQFEATRTSQVHSAS
ncbi:hypothetical protein AN403_5595 [Pseudomonas fluorescens]|uniref:Uncharacterized protein n=1 Tax=Pseudomonas fluorescens TaxID=294 RepID=A0A0P9BES0_PSEFL|nr:hypothetical protein AN403_5595 [Pseudomonas fluorescens]